MTSRGDLALVTGGSRGIGRATALGLARAGWFVLATARGRAALDSLAREAQAEGLNLAVGQLDLADREVGARAEALIAELGGGRALTLLINNAGHAAFGPLELLDHEVLERQFEVNVFGLLRLTQRLLPRLRETGRGRVVLVSSVLGRTTLPLHGAYCASKFALEALGDSLRQELAGAGVEVAMVEPGSVATSFDRLARAHLVSLRVALTASLSSQQGLRSAYAGAIEQTERVRDRARKGAVEPERIADAIVEIAGHRRRPPARVVLPARAKLQLVAARVLPTRVSDLVLARSFGLDWRSLGAGRGVGRDAGRRAGRRPDPRAGAALVTGAAGGVGRAIVAELLELGMRVWASDRDELGLEALAQAHANHRASLEILRLDVTDHRAIDAAAERLADQAITLVVNNAGYAELGPLELVDPEAIRRQFDVNVFGLLAVTRAFVGRMRGRGCGRIINVSSIAGRLAFPGMGVYHASKFAVEAISDALRIELAGFGIEVVAIEPGLIRSRFAATARVTPNAERYAHRDAQLDAVIDRLEQLGAEPRDVAKLVRRAVVAKHPRPRYQAPMSAVMAALVLPYLPATLLDRMWRRLFELDVDPS